ncbi:MAG: hypothetical protein EZS28_025851 [Streblomastix strix]|uniref:Clathrin/coatomer adaptor adaptin-like N-terminal domain-containing protein n=1 Tax=Streblomastix strix TaxID=222440 RepID=A0A5J4V7Y8_9EUKA|nr:MAG: hypothetical protein EZS28_025851 [Streblomastix strix]
MFITSSSSYVLLNIGFDPTHQLPKIALNLMNENVPHLEPNIKLLVAKSRVFEDLAQIIEGKPDGYTAEVVCNVIDQIIKNNREGIEYALFSKLIIAIKRVLSVEHNKIKRVHLAALARFTVYGDDHQRADLYGMDVLPTLVILLNHPDKTIVGDAVIAINNIILGGARTTDSEKVHPYLQTLDQEHLGAIEELFDIFTRSKDEPTKRNAALAIGRLYRSLPLPQRYLPIISLLKQTSKSPEQNIAWNSIGTLGYLGVNEKNHPEILKDDYVTVLVDNLYDKPDGIIHFSLSLLQTLHKVGSVSTRQIIKRNVNIKRLKELSEFKDEGVSSHAHAMLARLK